MNGKRLPPPQCPITYPETSNCTNDTKPGQIIDSYGCLIWTCVPNQPYCCPRTSPETIKCTAESEPGQIVDTKTNCKIWTCVPKQPYCCERTDPTQKCPENNYNTEVYDPKTGCSIRTCVPCPDITYDELTCCFIGFPTIGVRANGCPYWTCSSILDEIIYESLK